MLTDAKLESKYFFEVFSGMLDASHVNGMLTKKSFAILANRFQKTSGMVV